MVLLHPLQGHLDNSSNNRVSLINMILEEAHMEAFPPLVAEDLNRLHRNKAQLYKTLISDHNGSQPRELQVIQFCRLVFD